MTAAEHTLIGDGRSFYALAPAHCTCWWVSGWLLTDEARRQAHAQHVTEEKSP